MTVRKVLFDLNRTVIPQPCWLAITRSPFDAYAFCAADIGLAGHKVLVIQSAAFQVGGHYPGIAGLAYGAAETGDVASYKEVGLDLGDAARKRDSGGDGGETHNEVCVNLVRVVI